MKDRIKTLILDADGHGWKAVFMDTTLRGLLGLKSGVTVPTSLRKYRLGRTLQWYIGGRYQALSYAIDWREAICAAPELDVKVCNINNLVGYFRCLRAIKQYPLIIILHSVAGDSMSLLLKTAHWFQRRRGKLVVFIGNEYDLMTEKFAFLQATGAEYVGSQLPIEAARWLYAECQPTQVLAMPHALNPELYYPDSRLQRSLDIGFIGAIYPYFLGDTERSTLIRFFQRHGAELELKCQVRIGNVPRFEWARFLNTCKGIVGAEAGTFYLDRKGQILSQARAYLREHPEATFEEVFERFFQSPQVEYVSGKCISSRHFEPIGTKTCQVLLEGYYNGILRPDEHYISVNKDLSNLDDVVRRFKDDDYRTAMVERAFEYVMDQHTYRHRVKALLETVLE